MTNPARTPQPGEPGATKERGRGGRGRKKRAEGLPPPKAPGVVVNDEGDGGAADALVNDENRQEQAEGSALRTPPQPHVWRPDDIADEKTKKPSSSKAEEEEDPSGGKRRREQQQEEEDGTVFRAPAQPTASGDAATGKRRKRKRGGQGKNKEEKRSEEGKKADKERRKEKAEESEDEGTTVRRARELVAARKSEEKEQQEDGPCSSAEARARTAAEQAAAAGGCGASPYRPADPTSDSASPMQEIERLLWLHRRTRMAWDTVNYTILTLFPDLAACPPESASPFVFTSNRGRERLQAMIDKVARDIAAGRTTRSKREQAAKRKRAELNKKYGDRLRQLNKWLREESARDEELKKEQVATAARPAAAQ